jgi:CheY-like chemotaxis protein/nitrogen-specific signal transduction histidine kinase/predicted hydrocarbon binding protein
LGIGPESEKRKIIMENPKTEREKALEAKVAALEQELARLREKEFATEQSTVKVFPEVAPLFEAAEKTVGAYFDQMQVDPSKASIEIAGQRYVLLRASSLSVDFIQVVQQLYADKGPEEAFDIGRNFLFDIAHVIGMEDAANFHETMDLTDPIAKLSAGPVHFAYSGWAFVELLSDSNPSPDEDFYLHYRHPYSFEAEAWINAGKSSEKPVCIMNSGYSSGWCEKSFGMELTAVEVSCRACGDEYCSFIMAPPHKIEEHLQKYSSNEKKRSYSEYSIPTFFNRKKVEEQIQIAKEKAESSDLAKSQFLANMSHEIRTPLNTIMGYADILTKELQDEELKEYIQNIQYSSQHLLSIINDILDLSKIEAGQLMLHEGPCDLMLMMKKMEDAGQSLLREGKKVELEWAIDENIHPIIQTDRIKLQQILFNLLSNAIKFTEFGSIQWGCTFKGEKLLFYMKDTGIGIPEEKAELIFEMFQQVDSSVSRKFGGTGLGLTITKRLVELLEGEIWMESQVGKGSTFYFSLPYKIAKQDLKELRSKANFENSEHPTGYRILLAEDNLMNQKMTAFILRKAGYEVLLADNGKEALTIYEEQANNIDLILMDIQMPIMDGFDAVKAIREKELNMLSYIPIIALTAHAMKGDMEHCLEVGCNAYLTKPIKATELHQKIQQLIK